ncbi:unnamed protein product [Somion occarium]|uniref:F-box domain-containing protein n=1 Tax=Somion occarium TaxID=3059160 RepID=A0ABP1EC95_9APHY
MDSEDERILRDADERGGISGLHLIDPDVEFRLYENKEGRLVRKRLRGSKHGLDSAEPDPAFVIRLHRFFHTLRGFHKGKLDLSGRHEQRYRSLWIRWKTFYFGIRKLSVHAVPYQYPLRDEKNHPVIKNGQPVYIQDLTIDPPELLEEFRKKWKIDERYSLVDLFKETEETWDVILKHPQPKFQKLCLQDLPVELLHAIMKHASIYDVRRLGATSHLFHDISISYVFESRNLRLQCARPIDEANILALPMDQRRRYRTNLMKTARKVFLEEVKFLISREDILSRLRKLKLSDEWTDYIPLTTFIDDVDGKATFYEPIIRAIGDLLVCAPNISEVVLSPWIITSSLCKCLAVSKLETLTISHCIADLTFEDQIHDLPLSMSVRSVTFTLSTMSHLGSWRVLSLLPFVENLSIRGVNELRFLGNTTEPIAVPVLEIRPTLNPWQQLRKFSMSTVSSMEVQTLASWIQVIRETAPLPFTLQLTHFKLAVECGIEPDDLFDLLRQLHGAPLQYLVLDGLRYAHPDLLDRIAQAFPNLISLSLLYRESPIQYKSGFANWPHASWEYAPRLANFNHLRYLGWNFRIGIRASTTYVLHFFENGFPTKREWKDKYQSQHLDVFRDGDSIARLLHAHCPTLETIALLPGRGVPPIVYRNDVVGGVCAFKEVDWAVAVEVAAEHGSVSSDPWPAS